MQKRCTATIFLTGPLPDRNSEIIEVEVTDVVTIVDDYTATPEVMRLVKEFLERAVTGIKFAESGPPAHPREKP